MHGMLDALIGVAGVSQVSLGNLLRRAFLRSVLSFCCAKYVLNPEAFHKVQLITHVIALPEKASGTSHKCSQYIFAASTDSRLEHSKFGNWDVSIYIRMQR